MFPPRLACLTDAELAAESKRVGDEWDALDPEDEGHSGSPNEDLSERLCEIETEQKRRTKDPR